MLVGSLLTFCSLVLAYRALRFQMRIPLRNLRQSAFFELVVKPTIESATKLVETTELLLAERLPAIADRGVAGASLIELTAECARLIEEWKTAVRPVERRLGACTAAWRDEALLNEVRIAFEAWTDDVSREIDRHKSGDGQLDDALSALSTGMSRLLGVVVAYDVHEWIDEQTRSKGRVRRFLRDQRKAISRLFGK